MSPLTVRNILPKSLEVFDDMLLLMTFPPGDHEAENLELCVHGLETIAKTIGSQSPMLPRPSVLAVHVLANGFLGTIRDNFSSRSFASATPVEFCKTQNSPILTRLKRAFCETRRTVQAGWRPAPLATILWPFHDLWHRTS
jgi:hypothetical protein